MRADSWVSDDAGVLLANNLLQVRQISVSSMDNNVYLVTCARTGVQALVDAADKASQITDLVASAGNGELQTVITTHRHWDHHRALVDVVAATGATTAAGSADADHLPVATGVVLEHHDTVAVGDLRLQVVSLRGHTPGSIALALDYGSVENATVLFTGDSLFPGGPGKTESAADFTSLMDDVSERLFGEYDDSAVVLPGHGDGTTLGAERGQLSHWRQRGW